MKNPTPTGLTCIHQEQYDKQVNTVHLQYLYKDHPVKHFYISEEKKENLII